MIEAVNSVLQTAPFVRASNEQVSTVDSLAANPERVQRAPQAPQAPFVSPFIHVDVNLNKAVIQLRNGETGDVEDQFPSNAALEARARQAARQQAQSQQEAIAAPQSQEQSAQAFVQQTSPDSGRSAESTNAVTAQQQAAFAAAAQSGNSNAGNVTLLA